MDYKQWLKRLDTQQWPMKLCTSPWMMHPICGLQLVVETFGHLTMADEIMYIPMDDAPLLWITISG